MRLLGTGKQRAAKNSRVTVNGATLNKTGWRLGYNVVDLDTVNFESNGFDEGIAGVFGVDWSIEGDWDAGQNDFADPPGLYPRDDLPDLQFFENTTDNVVQAFDYARVLAAENSAAVRDKVKFNASGKTQGSFAHDTVSV